MTQRLETLAGPLLLIVAVAAVSEAFPQDIKLRFYGALVTTAMVVALYVFTGMSGVISFGHVSFVAIGAFTAGVLSVDPTQKQNVYGDMFPILRDNQLDNLWSLVVAALAGAIVGFVVGIPLMRLSGLAAGIATFAVLGITRNVYRNWTKIGPGAQTLPFVPETTRLVQATVGLVVVVVIAWAYQGSRWGRRLRAGREDPAAAEASGISIYRERLIAFTLSGALAGFAGGLYVRFLGSIQTEQVYLELTFLILAMLVVGGINSLWGAVVGGLVINLLDTFLDEGEQTIDWGAVDFTLPRGSGNVVLAIIMGLVLVLRPSGITGGREFRWPRPAPKPPSRVEAEVEEVRV